MQRSTLCRALCAAFVLLGVSVLWLAVWPSPVQAHPCDDLYTRQQDRETCWWNYWNSLASQPSPPPKLYPVAKPYYLPPAEPVRQYTTKPHRLHPGDPRIAPWDRVVTPVPAYKVYPVRQYTTKPHRLHPNDPRIAPWDRRVTPAPVQPVYLVPAPQTTYPPPRNNGRYCTDFDSRAQYEHFFAERQKPSQHDQDRDGVYCDDLW